MLTYSFGLDDAGFGRHWEGFGQGALGQTNVYPVGEGGSVVRRGGDMGQRLLSPHSSVTP